MNRAQAERAARNRPGRAARALTAHLTAAESATRVYTPGHAQFARGLVAGLTASGRCLSCGRKLTDPESTARGIGPDCLTKWGGQQAWEHRIGALTRQGGELR